MLDAIKPLLDSDLINEDTKHEIQEAWDSKLVEVRDQVTAELREEFAGKYEHDKSVMVEALDRMVTDNLTEEINQIVEQRSQLEEDQARFTTRMQEASGTFDKFMLKTLADEINELHSDKKDQSKVTENLETFIVNQLAEEITDFQHDRQDVINTKVKLVKEARSKFGELKKSFVDKSAVIVKQAVSENLKSEISQLKEDINAAKENNFGRKIFEAYASEFSSSYLNENQEIKELKALVDNKDKTLAEAEVAIAEKEQIIESKQKEVQTIVENTQRKETLAELTKTLNKEKGAVMRDLLESVQTSKLQDAFNRYLPAVIDGESVAPRRTKEVIRESRKEVTGDKEIKENKPVEQDGNIIELRKLAGLK